MILHNITILAISYKLGICNPVAFKALTQLRPAAEGHRHRMIWISHTNMGIYINTLLKIQSITFQIYQLYSFSIAVKQISTNLGVHNIWIHLVTVSVLQEPEHSFRIGIWVLCSGSPQPQSVRQLCGFLFRSEVALQAHVVVGKDQFLSVVGTRSSSFHEPSAEDQSKSLEAVHISLPCGLLSVPVTTWQLTSSSPAGEFLAQID